MDKLLFTFLQTTRPVCSLSSMRYTGFNVEMPVQSDDCTLSYFGIRFWRPIEHSECIVVRAAAVMTDELAGQRSAVINSSSSQTK